MHRSASPHRRVSAECPSTEAADLPGSSGAPGACAPCTTGNEAGRSHHRSHDPAEAESCATAHRKGVSCGLSDSSIRVTEVTSTVLMRPPSKSSQRSGAICTFEYIRCQMPPSMRPQRISRLQGVSPLVSPYRRQSVAELCGGLFFHGLCSPSRSAYASLLPLSRKTSKAFASAAPDARCIQHRLQSESPSAIPSPVA
jgi:hypothetical protein